jgi:hypothetical protein
MASSLRPVTSVPISVTGTSNRVASGQRCWQPSVTRCSRCATATRSATTSCVASSASSISRRCSLRAMRRTARRVLQTTKPAADASSKTGGSGCHNRIAGIPIAARSHARAPDWGKNDTRCATQSQLPLLVLSVAPGCSHLGTRGVRERAVGSQASSLSDDISRNASAMLANGNEILRHDTRRRRPSAFRSWEDPRAVQSNAKLQAWPDITTNREVEPCSRIGAPTCLGEARSRR